MVNLLTFVPLKSCKTSCNSRFSWFNEAINYFRFLFNRTVFQELFQVRRRPVQVFAG